jgi:uncharacterized membrane protein
VRTLLLEITRATAVLLTGLFAGGVFFLVLAPSLGRLPGPAYVRYWQALNTDYGRAMPPLLLTCLALLIATCVLSYRRGWLVFGLSLASLGLMAIVLVLTISQFEPLNQLANSWDPDQLPPDWASARDRWLALHNWRTALAIAAFAALLCAMATDRLTPPEQAASTGSGPTASSVPAAGSGPERSAHV